MNRNLRRLELKTDINTVTVHEFVCFRARPVLVLWAGLEQVHALTNKSGYR